MTQLEERLSAALDARAHQIDEADLSPGEVPVPGSRRRGLVILAAAACTALVIGVPYAIAQLDSSKHPTPPANTPSDTPSVPGVGEGASWPVTQVGRVDLDGDGADETMRLRVEPVSDVNPSGARSARVEVELPDGTVFTVLPESAAEFHLEGAVAIDGSAGEELLVGVGTSLRVLDLVDGELKVLDPPHDPALVRRTDSEGRAVTWTTDSSGLFSMRSIDPVADRPKYAVERWQWLIADGVLVARQVDGGCVDADSPRDVGSCSPAVPARLTPLGPTDIRIGTEIELPFTIEGEPARARLVNTDPQWPGGDVVPDGLVELVVTAGAHTWQVALPEGPVPYLFTFPTGVAVSPTGGDSANIAVGRFGNLDVYWEVYHLVDGELVQLATPSTGPTLGTTYDDTDDSFPPQTPVTLSFAWVQGSWIYSWHGEGARKQVYRWEQGGRSLVPVSIGTYCTDGHELIRC